MVAVPQAGGSSLRSSVIDALGRWARNQSGLITLLVEFDDSGQWAYDGSWSCAHWVAERADLELATVREWLRIGHALSKLDEVARRFAAKTLSYSKVRALIRIATPENQHDLCAIAQEVPASRFAVALAAWLERNETPDEHKRRHRAATGLSWRVEPDGMVFLPMRLPPETFGKVRAAIEAKMLHTHSGENDAGGAVLTTQREEEAEVAVDQAAASRRARCTRHRRWGIDRNRVGDPRPRRRLHPRRWHANCRERRRAPRARRIRAVADPRRRTSTDQCVRAAPPSHHAPETCRA